MARGAQGSRQESAGFIGSHLCERLLAGGWEIYALDDLSTGATRFPG